MAIDIERERRAKEAAELCAAANAAYRRTGKSPFDGLGLGDTPARCHDCGREIVGKTHGTVCHACAQEDYSAMYYRPHLENRLPGSPLYWEYHQPKRGE